LIREESERGRSPAAASSSSYTLFHVPPSGHSCILFVYFLTSNTKTQQILAHPFLVFIPKEEWTEKQWKKRWQKLLQRKKTARGFYSISHSMSVFRHR